MFIFKHIMLVAALIAVPLAAQQTEKVYTPADGIVLPKVKQKVEPAYTEDAEARQVMGEVTLSLEIDKDGKSQNVQVVKSLDPGLDRSAIAAVNNWTWVPATKDGQPVTCAVKVSVSFKLQ